MILQTQIEKEYNKWEHERIGYQQDIYNLKKKVIDLQHLVKKYQHNEMFLNHSRMSCNCSMRSFQFNTLNP